jgi:long-chain acyl-CoA synthetase
MRAHLATYLDDFDRLGRETAVVQVKGIRRHSTTYAELARNARRFAAFLVERNISTDDRVLLWAENSAEWLAIFYGCLMRGVVIVPLDAAGSTAFAQTILADVSPKLLVGDATLLAQLPAELPCPRLALEELPATLPQTEAPIAAGLNLETTLQILFTSGTTGDPKGIVITHGNVIASVGPIEIGAQPYMRYIHIIHPLRILLTLPLSHVFGQTMGLWIPPILGSELHLENKLVATRIISHIKRERISVLAAVPRVFALLKAQLVLDSPDLAAQLDASTGLKAWQRWWRFRKIHRKLGLKFWAFVSGGGALNPELEKFWSALGFVVIQGYGMTESTALITLNHPFRVSRGTIGKPMPGRQIRIAPDGELLVKGSMISGATWSGGHITPRADEWLSTGDLAERLPSGDFKFLGRKSEVIVTSAGLNLHPEDLEAAFENDPTVAAVAVIPLETPNGPEPCAVLALRHSNDDTTQLLARANAKLADFQQLRHTRIWPEPDLPRTSTGKIRRKFLTEWLASSSIDNLSATLQNTRSDWLVTLITSLTGSAPTATDDAARLIEDIGLDSLARVQLEAAIEERLGLGENSTELAIARTLGDLRRIIAPQSSNPSPASQQTPDSNATDTAPPTTTQPIDPDLLLDAEVKQYIFPRWPWTWPISLLRIFFIECIVRPLVWLLAAPKVVAAEFPLPAEPIIIISNHISTYDGPLIHYALPGKLRRHISAAMMGEMLENYRRFRNPETTDKRFDLFSPLKYLLLTALFNVFPLPRYRNFQQSFDHAGRAMDHGFNILILPEGTRSKTGALSHFKGGIGLLVKQANAAVLPVAIHGLAPFGSDQKHWFRSGTIEVRIGQPVKFSVFDSEAVITARLEAEVARLLSKN